MMESKETCTHSNALTQVGCNEFGQWGICLLGAVFRFYDFLPCRVLNEIALLAKMGLLYSSVLIIGVQLHLVKV